MLSTAEQTIALLLALARHIPAADAHVRSAPAKWQRAKFVGGATENGVNEKKGGQIFDLMEHFAGYGFPKAHSTAYALP